MGWKRSITTGRVESCIECNTPINVDDCETSWNEYISKRKQVVLPRKAGRYWVEHKGGLG